ncbi:hypothetical protein AB4099_05515 [Bosea sp. 2KB_26]|uniref:hypothetical protein n=1 Tax=Bosea sp. 2KB_26 TaxID=3237475 RepID=UPI003F9357C9
MDIEKKPYAITEYAGWYVAGRKVPSRRDEDGNLVPLVGHVLYLTDAEAKYEELHRSIVPAEPTPAAPVEPTAPAPSADVADEAGGGKRRRA